MLSPKVGEGYDLSLVACAWSLWGMALLSVIFRFVSRRLIAGPGFKRFLAGLKADDYLMVVALPMLMGVALTSNEVAAYGSNYVPEGETKGWSDLQIADARWGSKMLLALEEFMIGTLWLVKACLLVLYARMTSGLRESIAVKVTAAYCALSFVIIQVLYLGVWCRPITNYWAVPIPPGNEQCKTYHSHLITTTVLHVSTDLAMLAIPIPMIARTRLPLRRRLVLCGVFGLGVLVVLLAILNRYYNFVMPHDLVFLAWYNGEASTAVVIANVPFCWALLRRVFALDSWGGNSHDGGLGREGGDGNVNGDGQHQPPPTIGSGGPPRRGRGRGRGDDDDDDDGDSNDEGREEGHGKEGGLRAMGRVMGGRNGFGFVQTKSVSITVEYAPRPGWRPAPAAAPARDTAALSAAIPASGEEDGVELLERGVTRGRGEPGS